MAAITVKITPCLITTVGNRFEEQSVNAYMRLRSGRRHRSTHYGTVNHINTRRGKPFIYSVITYTVLAACLILIGLYGYERGWVLSFRPRLQIDVVLSGVDINGNGLDDSLDIVMGARAQIGARPKYKSAYYDGGYPPDNEGVCTDLVWRALACAGYDLKTRIDDDIRLNHDQYPRTQGKPDPNIDFRRVPNVSVFLKHAAHSLTTEVIPWNAENLAKWQAGDLVIFGQDSHIGIVSDTRTRSGVPLIIHHGAGRPRENNALGYWKDKITGHYRIELGLKTNP